MKQKIVFAFLFFFPVVLCHAQSDWGKVTQFNKNIDTTTVNFEFLYNTIYIVKKNYYHYEVFDDSNCVIARFELTDDNFVLLEKIKSGKGILNKLCMQNMQFRGDLVRREYIPEKLLDLYFMLFDYDIKHWNIDGAFKDPNTKTDGWGLRFYSFGAYLGQFKNGVMHGDGVIFLKSGGKILGTFQNGLINTQMKYNITNKLPDTILDELHLK